MRRSRLLVTVAAREEVVIFIFSLVAAGRSPQNRNFWRPEAKVPSGHGAQLGDVVVDVPEVVELQAHRAVQPWSLVTSPVHSIGLTQLEAIVQVWITVFSSMKTSLVFAHSPFDEHPIGSVELNTVIRGVRRGRSAQTSEHGDAVAAMPRMTPVHA